MCFYGNSLALQSWIVGKTPRPVINQSISQNVDFKGDVILEIIPEMSVLTEKDQTNIKIVINDLYISLDNKASISDIRTSWASCMSHMSQNADVYCIQNTGVHIPKCTWLTWIGSWVSINMQSESESPPGEMDNTDNDDEKNSPKDKGKLHGWEIRNIDPGHVNIMRISSGSAPCCDVDSSRSICMLGCSTVAFPSNVYLSIVLYNTVHPTPSLPAVGQ